MAVPTGEDNAVSNFKFAAGDFIRDGIPDSNYLTLRNTGTDSLGVQIVRIGSPADM
jgi:hypothetical protein